MLHNISNSKPQTGSFPNTLHLNGKCCLIIIIYFLNYFYPACLFIIMNLNAYGVALFFLLVFKLINLLVVS